MRNPSSNIQYIIIAYYYNMYIPYVPLFHDSTVPVLNNSCLNTADEGSQISKIDNVNKNSELLLQIHII
jgi:hypothetical protein